MEKVQRKFVLVTRKTRFQELVERFNTWSQAEFYLTHNQIDAKDYLAEHDLYAKRLIEAENILKPMGYFQKLERDFLPNYQFGSSDIIVVIGQDGLVANTIKYLRGQPVVAVNPDPQRWDGKLLPFEIGELRHTISHVLKHNFDRKIITLAEAKTNDGQSMLAVNDLFIGPKSHTSARYTISWGKQRETQSSSGIIISTGFGSTGWFQSILAGAEGITNSQPHELKNGFNWSEKFLQFTVREPFPSKTTNVKLVFGKISKSLPLIIESQIPENGVIFSDGIESDYIPFNSGLIVTVGVSSIQGELVV